MVSQTYIFPGRRIAWFSCGAASAVAAKLALEKGPCELLYCDTMASEHPDNERFLADVEKWLGQSVERIRSDKYTTVDQVFEGERYMSGIAGARCTAELKKKPRFRFQNPEDIHIFGLTADEERRIVQFERNNHELRLEWPLRDAGLTKADTLRIVEEAGIELPVMYRLGFANNNCIGCVKAQSPAYWNLVRRNFPEVFERRAAQSRALGVRLARLHGERVFLDEIPEDTTETVTEDLSCGPQCAPPDPVNAEVRDRHPEGGNENTENRAGGGSLD